MAKQQEEKTPIQILKQAIKAKEPRNLYFFYGEEMFLLRHYLEQLRLCVVDPLTESFNYHRLNSENFDVRTLADAVENLPMMAERTMVQVDDVDLFKLPEEDRDVVAQVLSDVPEYCTLVFTYETVIWKPDKRYKKLWDAVSDGEMVEFAKQSQRDLVAWIQRHFMAAGKQISPELCLYLLEITDGTMTSLAGEIAKIAAFSGADTVCKADIDAVTEPVLDAVAFRMADQLGSGEYAVALQTLQKLLKLQQDPIMILGAIGSHFRRLSVARTLLDHGKGHFELQKICGLSEYPAKKLMTAARRFSPNFCALAAELIVQTDSAMKTSFDDNDRLLEMLILRLAQEAKNG